MDLGKRVQTSLPLGSVVGVDAPENGSSTTGDVHLLISYNAQGVATDLRHSTVLPACFHFTDVVWYYREYA